MRFDVLTLFPEMIDQSLSHSITGRALTDGVLSVGVHDIRDWSTNKHRNVDDAPYGGGPGMVMSAEPIVAALESIEAPVARRLLMSPAGRRFDQGYATELASLDGSVVLVCGRYEGVDQRVADHFVDEELSVGDYVLSGGELAALVVISAQPDVDLPATARGGVGQPGVAADGIAGGRRPRVSAVHATAHLPGSRGAGRPL